MTNPCLPPDVAFDCGEPITARTTFRSISISLVATLAMGIATTAVAKNDPEEIERDLNELFDVIEEVLPNIPRDSFDVQAIVDEIGSDQDQLLAWVRDNTAWLPYQGALRGPKGVLLDRAGNSLDRALLLSALFEAAGHQTRLKRAELPPDVAEALIQNERARAVKPENVSDYDLLADIVDRLEAKNSRHAEDFARSAKEFRRDRRELIDSARDRADRQAKRLLSMIDVPENQEEQLKAQAIEAATDHWWVESKVESKWQPFDPSASDAMPVPGKQGKGRGTFKPDRLPAKSLHTVTVRIIVEQLQGKRLRERVALEHKIVPSVEPVVQLALSHVPEEWPEELTPMALLEHPDPLNEFIATATKQTKWIPVMQVGSEQVFSKGFTDTGDLYKPGGETAGAGGTTKSFGGLAGGLSGGGGGGKGILTAEWFEFEFESPGSPSYKIRRSTFDLLGPAARKNKGFFGSLPSLHGQARALSLIESTDVLIQGSKLTDHYLSYESLSGAAAARKNFIEAFVRPTEVLTGTFTPEGNSGAPLSGNTSELASARAFHIEATGYFTRPNIIAYRQYSLPSTSGKLIRTSGFDIISNPKDLGPGIFRDFSANVRSGVMDTVLEVALIGESDKTYNTSNLFETLSNDSWQVLNSTHQEDLTATGIESDTIEQINVALDAGFLVVLPRDNLDETVSWWRVDPKSGETVGIGPHGWGEGATEYSVSLWKVSLNVGSTVNCIWGSVKSMDQSEGKLSGGEQAKAIIFSVGCMAASMTGLAGTLAGISKISYAGSTISVLLGAAKNALN